MPNPPRASRWTRSRSGGTSSLVLVLVLSWVGAAAAQGPVVIVDARVSWSDALLADGGLVFGLQVEEVVHGFAPGGLLVARAAAETSGDPVERFLEARPGGTVRVELRARADGLYDLVSAHDIPQARYLLDEEPSAPPAILAEPRTEDITDAVAHPTRAVPDRVISAAEDTSFEQDVVELVNEQRWSYDQHAPAGADNLPPLKRAAELTTSTEGHSFNMADRNFFAHCDLDTLSSPWQRMNDAGYFWSSAGENAAAGQASPAAVMSSWMTSTGHRANIMGTSFREIGVGYYLQSGDQANIRRDTLPVGGADCIADSFNNGPYGSYWTQNFGSRGNVYPVVINREASSTTSQTVTLYVYGAGYATQMRFSNDGSTWSAWEPYSTAKTWTLSAGGGDKQVWAQLDTSDSGTDPNHTASDTITYSATCASTTLQNQELDGSPSSYQNCQIIAGPNVPVTGDTTFLASRVRLRDGFRVESGVELHVRPQP